MYLSILFLPLLGSVVSGLLGRKIGVTGSHIITCSSLGFTSVMAAIAFYEVGICGSPVSIYLTSWIDSELMSISWGFLFDSLTVSMLIPVLFVSTLVHIYSISYMGEDQHNQRFFSYLSLFTFFMLVLVTGDSYLTMFIGRGENFILQLFLEIYDGATLQESFLASPILLYAGKKGSEYGKPRQTTPLKLGVDLSSEQTDILIGTLLGDSRVERIKSSHNSRFRFEQAFPNHASYLTFLYSHFLNLVGSHPKVVIRKPDIRTGKVYSQIRFATLSFPCFNVFHDMFYEGNTKIVPANIASLLTPRALAFWIMDDGGKGPYNETILHTNSYTLEEVKLLQKALMGNFNIETRLILKRENQWLICIPVKQQPILRAIVTPYMHSSMLYKISSSLI